MLIIEYDEATSPNCFESAICFDYIQINTYTLTGRRILSSHVFVSLRMVRKYAKNQNVFQDCLSVVFLMTLATSLLVNNQVVIAYYHSIELHFGDSSKSSSRFIRHLYANWNRQWHFTLLCQRPFLRLAMVSYYRDHASSLRIPVYDIYAGNRSLVVGSQQRKARSESAEMASGYKCKHRRRVSRNSPKPK